jgi:nucleoid DNA-binding protein
MIKDDLAQEIAEKHNLSHNLSTKIVQTILDKMVDGLIQDSRIELRRFGVFATKDQAPRIITLPSGKKIKSPAQKVVTFAPSPTLKKKLNPK